MRLVLALAAVLTATASTGPALDYPTSVAVERSGSLLVVENGLRRLVRVDSAGAVRQVARLAKPYAAIETRRGRVYVGDGRSLKELRPGAPARTLATVESDIGPLAFAAGGAIVFTTQARLYRLVPGGTPVRLVPRLRLSGPHGVAVEADGSILVADTDRNRILRIVGTQVSTFAGLGGPRGLAVAADGTVYAVAAAAKRVARFGPDGRARGLVGPRFVDPYAVAVSDGVLYVVDTGPAGTVVRVPVS